MFEYHYLIGRTIVTVTAPNVDAAMDQIRADYGYQAWLNAVLLPAA